MVDMRNRHQPQVPRHSLQQSPWSITGSNVALAPSRDHRCTTVPSPSPATCSDMQYHVLQRSCSTAPCRLSIWMPPAVVSRWATTSGQYLAHASKSDPSRLSLSYGLVLQRRRVYPRRVEGILRPSNWSFVNTL